MVHALLLSAVAMRWCQAWPHDALCQTSQLSPSEWSGSARLCRAGCMCPPTASWTGLIELQAKGCGLSNSRSSNRACLEALFQLIRGSTICWLMTQLCQISLCVL